MGRDTAVQQALAPECAFSPCRGGNARSKGSRGCPPHERSSADASRDDQAFSEHALALGRFLYDHADELLGRAARLIRHYGVIDPAFGAEDAVEEALQKLVQAMKDGKIQPIESEYVLAKLVWHNLSEAVLDQRARERAGKRGGPGASHAGRAAIVRVGDGELEGIESRDPAPDARIADEDEVEQMLALLDGHHRRLRDIAVMRREGFTNRAIAARLGLALPTVNRLVRLMKAILRQHSADGVL